MCYASPGPRCEGHATERYEKVSEKSRKIVSDLLKTESELEKYAKERPDDIGNAEHKGLLKKKNKLQDDAVKASKKVKEAREDMDATRGGMDTLRYRIAEVNAGRGSEDDTADLATLHRRLELGRKNYKTKMDAYDAKNETVDGRSPSPYGDDEGIQTFTNRMKKIKAKYDASSSYGERNELYAKYHATSKARTHAMTTREHAKNGIINPYKASLKSNQKKLKESTAEHQKAYVHLVQMREERQAFYTKIREVEQSERQQRRTTPSKYSVGAKRQIAQYQDEMLEHSKKHFGPATKAEAEARKTMNTHSLDVMLAGKDKAEIARTDAYVSRSSEGYGEPGRYGMPRYSGD